MRKISRCLGVCIGALLVLGKPSLADPPAETVGHGLDLSALDPSVSPCQDMFQYANGGWLKHASIDPQHGSAGVDREIDDRSEGLLHEIVDTAAADTSAPESSAEGKVGAFYRSGMDTARIEADGLRPLAPELARINAVHDMVSLEQELARLDRLAVFPAFNTSVGQDDENSAQQIVQLFQGGLGLPEQGCYIRADADSAAVRAAYVAYITRTFALLGDTPAQSSAEAQAVMALETQLALVSMTPVQQRDPAAVYHKMTLAQLDALTPGVSWEPFFASLGLSQPGPLNVAQPKFFQIAARMMTTLPLSDWKTYLRWSLVNTEAPRLPQAFADANFQFYSTTLGGIPAQRPRWKRMIDATDAALGEDLGQLYVARAFAPDAKARALALVQNVKSALRGDLQTLPWMSASTRAQAISKLDSMAVKIGYPDRWRDYSNLHVNSPSYVVNGMRADEFEFQRTLSKVGKPVDRGEWGMTPRTNNAYYSPQMNDINFPAGILQPPYFDPQADDAVNYGEIGATIGHEMTHGFDDEGRQYDGQGTRRNWWTAQDAANFAARAQGIVAQYSAYSPLPGLHINGTLTQGENIADIGGLKIAYLALEKALGNSPRAKQDGFTPEQRFFIAYAQSWRTLERPEGVRVRLTSDPHSTAQFRVNGPVADMPEFRAAFGCPPSVSLPAGVW